MPEPKESEKTSRHHWHRFAPLLTLGLFVAALFVLHRELRDVRLTQVAALWHGLSNTTLLLAVLFSAGSYLALTLHDALSLRVVGRTLPWRRVMETSFIAYAFSHTLGLSALSGGSVRLRAYGAEGLGTAEIALVQGLCTLIFALGVSATLGLSLALDPTAAAEVLHLPKRLFAAMGGLMLGLLLAWVAIGAMPRVRWRIGSWELRPPAWRLTLAQIIVGVADIVLAGLAMWVLLPDPAPGPWAFVGIYVAALTLGSLSSVPGGLGVFESALLLMLPDMPTASVLGAALVYRVIYQLLPLALAVLLIVVQGASAAGGPLQRVSAPLRRAALVLIPQCVAIATFMAGAVLLVSGALPSIDTRLEALHEWLPLGVLETSHLIGSAIGAALLIVARGLFRRLDGAWWLTVFMLIGGIVASLLKGIDYEEAIVLTVVLALLLLARKRFDRHAPLLKEPLTPQWLISVGVVAAAAIWLGFLSHRHVPYSNDLWWRFAVQAQAPRMLRASVVVLLLLGAYALSRLLSTHRPPPQKPTAEDLEKAAEVVGSATQASASLALLGDKQFLFSDERDAFIMYQRSGGSWIAMGDPVGNAQRFAELIWRFRELCHLHGARCAFYQVSPERLSLYLDVGLSAAKLGEEARVDLRTFSLVGSSRGELRTALRKGEREGLTFSVVEQDVIDARIEELRGVSDAWLAHKQGAEKHFSVGRFDPAFVRRFPCALVEREGRIVAFATIWRSAPPHEMAVDLMRFCDDAPKGVMDYLFVQMLLWGQSQGYHWFGLGMAPLSGLERRPLAPLWHRLGRMVQHYGGPFYNFEGLRRYKDKFQPVWQPRYLASGGGLVLPQVLVDSATLIAGGVTAIVHK